MIFYSSRFDQNISRLEANSLMIEHEEGYSGVCNKMSKVPTIEIRIPKACNFASNNVNSYMELRNDSLEFYGGCFQDIGKV